MKEIYDYINSKAIREHCKAIGHEFNAMESAFLIYQSKNHTLQEKHLAWEHIIQTMDDTRIAERLNCPYIPSLHGFLRKYMDIQKTVLDRFFAKEAGYIYSFAPCSGANTTQTGSITAMNMMTWTTSAYTANTAQDWRPK